VARSGSVSSPELRTFQARARSRQSSFELFSVDSSSYSDLCTNSREALAHGRSQSRSRESDASRAAPHDRLASGPLLNWRSAEVTGAEIFVDATAAFEDLGECRIELEISEVFAVLGGANGHQPINALIGALRCSRRERVSRVLPHQNILYALGSMIWSPRYSTLPLAAAFSSATLSRSFELLRTRIAILSPARRP